MWESCAFQYTFILIFDLIWRVCLSSWRWAFDADYSTLNKVNVDASITIFIVASSLIFAWIQNSKTRLQSMPNIILGALNSGTDLKSICRMLTFNFPISNYNRSPPLFLRYFISSQVFIHRHRTITQSHNEQGGDLLSALCECLSIKRMTLSHIHHWVLSFQPRSNYSSPKAAGIKTLWNSAVLSTASSYRYLVFEEDKIKYGNVFYTV